MRKQALVIGLGQFGMALARSLTAKRVEVMAVDRDEDLVQRASTYVAEALCFDSTDEEALARVAPDKRDYCVVAIGDASRDSSIVTTALLRQMGAPFIITRANNEIQERIVRLVGAHEVVNPERAFGERLANRLAYRGVIDQVPIGEDLVFSELKVPMKAVGRTLTELALPRRFGITVVGIRKIEGGRGHVRSPRPTDPLEPEDILLVVGAPEGLGKLTEEL